MNLQMKRQLIRKAGKTTLSKMAQRAVQNVGKPIETKKNGYHINVYVCAVLATSLLHATIEWEEVLTYLPLFIILCFKFFRFHFLHRGVFSVVGSSATL